MTNEDALRKCCKTYEEASVLQQEIIKSKDIELRACANKIKRLEKIIRNNIKNGESFL